MVEENSRKSLLAPLIKTPLLIGSISSQFSGENSFNEVGKTGSKSTKNLGEKQCPKPQIYRLRKTSRWGLTELSDDRPVVRPTVIFKTVVPSVDRPADRGQDTESKSLCPVGRPAARGLSREQSSLDGRPSWSTGLLPELACTSVHVGRPANARSEN